MGPAAYAMRRDVLRRPGIGAGFGDVIPVGGKKRDRLSKGRHAPPGARLEGPELPNRSGRESARFRDPSGPERRSEPCREPRDGSRLTSTSAIVERGPHPCWPAGSVTDDGAKKGDMHGEASHRTVCRGGGQGTFRPIEKTAVVDRLVCLGRHSGRRPRLSAGKSRGPHVFRPRRSVIRRSGGGHTGRRAPENVVERRLVRLKAKRGRCL